MWTQRAASSCAHGTFSEYLAFSRGRIRLLAREREPGRLTWVPKCHRWRTGIVGFSPCSDDPILPPEQLLSSPESISDPQAWNDPSTPPKPRNPRRSQSCPVRQIVGSLNQPRRIAIYCLGSVEPRASVPDHRSYREETAADGYGSGAAHGQPERRISLILS
jgi:hypothetical protein